MHFAGQVVHLRISDVLRELDIAAIHTHAAFVRQHPLYVSQMVRLWSGRSWPGMPDSQ